MGLSYDWWVDMSELEYYAWYNDVFSDSELDSIEKIFKDSELFTGGTTDNNNVNLENRDSKIKFIESSNQDNRWIFERLTSTVNNANEKFFKFDLNRIESLQYTVYNKGQYYRDHLDLMYRSSSNAMRKLSFSLQLSDPNTYKGGDLVLKVGADPVTVSKTRGTVIFFPSYILHEVTPVTNGIRRSLVGWVTGPRWK